VPAASAPYKTRILVYRPTDPDTFNGTVIVEWLNVSGGLDAAADWITGHTELIRSGYAWVGVSAQKVGVEGGTSVVSISSSPLKKADPVRYASLSHPGDSFSYDIFAQAGQAVRNATTVRPLGDLPIRTVIAAGESQSAFRMVTYIDAIHPRDDIYDGFLVHSRGANGAPLSEAPQMAIATPSGAIIRTDVDVPVMIFQTETDLTLLGYAAARQDDGAHVRLWEVAGTSHADSYTIPFGLSDLGNSPDAATIRISYGLGCAVPINSGPQHFVLNAAIAALNAWVTKGTPPPLAPRLEISAGPPVKIVRDNYGNALGGIRTPYVDVPIAALSGDAQPGSLLCALFGSTQLFDDALLASLYPDHDTYVTAYDAAVDRAVQGGFVLPPDGELMKAAAAMSDIGK
jgi:Alpha/beta hydrolase domain